MHKIAFTLSLLFALNVVAAEAPPGHPTVPPMGHGQQATLGQLPNKGKALEVLDAGDYTYILVADQGQENWIAASHTVVKPGDLVHYSKGNMMHNFHSKALDRTFEKVLFTASIQVESSHPSVAEAASILKIDTTPEQLPNQGRVVSSIPSGGYTYIEVVQEGKSQWLAAPRVNVQDGALIRYGEGAVMTNFYSKKLDREFPEVLFLGSVQVVTE